MAAKRTSGSRAAPAAPPLVQSPRRGVLQVGGARMSLVDVLGGFYGIRSALQRQVGVCEKCILREAGRQAGESFVRAALQGGHLPSGEEGFRRALDAYVEAGFGDFSIASLDWAGPELSLVAHEAFEGWAFAERGDLQKLPACDYSCGAVEGMLQGLLAAEGRAGLRIICRESQCLGSGHADCRFVAGTWSALAESQAKALDHEHRGRSVEGANVISPLGVPVACSIVEQNDALELQVVGLEDRLSDYERLLANILTSSTDAIFSLDENLRVLTWNRGAELIYGYRSDEMVGQDFRKLVPPDLLEQGELELIDRKLRQAGYLNDFETERLTQDGRRLSVSLSTTLLRDGRGRVIGRSAIHRDITERKRMERALIQSEKLSAIGKLSAHVAHEVRNPLSSIRLNLELLGDELQAGAGANLQEAAQLLEAIQTEVAVLTRFTDEYLQFARLPRLQRESADLGLLAEELASFIETEAAQHSVEVRTDAEPALPEVSVDVFKLRQVLLNLARNAIEAMPSGGVLSFVVSRHPAGIELQVRDTGTGMGPSVISRIFDPFFTTKPGGTGLGLALSQQIIREHRGTIECQSTVGSGTTFSLVLPDDEPPPA